MLTLASAAVVAADVGVVIASSGDDGNGHLHVVVTEIQTTPEAVAEPSLPPLPENGALVVELKLPMPKSGPLPQKIVFTNAQGVADDSLSPGTYSINVGCTSRNPRFPEFPRGTTPQAVHVVAGHTVQLQIVCITGF